MKSGLVFSHDRFALTAEKAAREARKVCSFPNCGSKHALFGFGRSARSEGRWYCAAHVHRGADGLLAPGKAPDTGGVA